MQNETPQSNQTLEPYCLHNVEAERIIIGELFGRKERISQLAHLRPEYFYFAAHQDIYAKARKLHDAGSELNPFTFTLESDAWTAELGDLKKYLFGCISLASTSPFYGMGAPEVLVDLYQRRQIDGLAKQAILAIADTNNSVSVEIENIIAGISNLQRGNTSKSFQNEADVTDTIIKNLRDVRKPYSTGIPLLDECMGGGLYPSKSYGFAARKKVGKTIMGGTIAYNLSQQGIKHLFICGEMSPEEIHQRTLARATDSFPSAFREGYGKSNDFQRRLTDVCGRTNSTIYYNAPGLTFGELRSICSAAVSQKKVSGIILDYWQLVGGKEARKSTAEHLDEVAQWIADFARKSGIWTIVMAQINQEGNTRGGEGLRLAFDQVYQIHREDLSANTAWIEMMETRYTRWQNIGDENIPGLMLHEKGPYFAE